MEIQLNSVAARISIYYLAIILLLFPVLGASIVLVVEDNLEDTFVSHVRTYTRMFTDLLETQDTLTESQVESILDGVILSGNGVYAQYRDRHVNIVSPLNSKPAPQAEDFAFDSDGDQTYYITAILHAQQDFQAQLVLGFDETTTIEAIQKLKYQVVSFILLFSLASLAILVVFARRLTKPLSALEHDSKLITAGDLQRNLHVHSGLLEIDQLGDNLESMRSQLVGTNQRLSAEMDEREQAERANLRLVEQLRQSQKLETIGTLAGGVAHEFNNLLTPMRLNVELALEDAHDQPEVVTSLNMVLLSIHRAEDVVNQILAFGHKQSVDQRPVDVASTLQEAYSLVLPTVPANVTPRLEILKTSVFVRIDGSHLHQIILNLVKNSVRAMTGNETRGALTIRLDVRAEPPEIVSGGTENMALIEVSDTGEGMSAEVRSRALDPFFTTRVVGSGTGLGLSVVHGIVTAAGGKLAIISEPGDGTTVCIFLPTELPTELTTEAPDDEARDV